MYVSDSLAQSASDEPDSGADWYYSENGSEEEGKWLSLEEVGGSLRKGKGDPQSKGYRRTSLPVLSRDRIKKSELDSSVMQSPNSPYMPYPSGGLHRKTSSPTGRVQHDLILHKGKDTLDRIGLPRRVRPTQLFPDDLNSTEVPPFPRVVTEWMESEVTAVEDSPAMHTVSANAVHEKYAYKKPPSPSAAACDDVDFHLSGTDVVHVINSPEECALSDRVPFAQKNSRFLDQRLNTDDGYKVNNCGSFSEQQREVKSRTQLPVNSLDKTFTVTRSAPLNSPIFRFGRVSVTSNSSLANSSPISSLVNGTGLTEKGDSEGAYWKHDSMKHTVDIPFRSESRLGELICKGDSQSERVESRVAMADSQWHKRSSTVTSKGPVFSPQIPSTDSEKPANVMLSALKEVNSPMLLFHKTETQVTGLQRNLNESAPSHAPSMPSPANKDEYTWLNQGGLEPSMEQTHDANHRDMDRSPLGELRKKIEALSRNGTPIKMTSMTKTGENRTAGMIPTDMPPTGGGNQSKHAHSIFDKGTLGTDRNVDSSSPFKTVSTLPKPHSPLRSPLSLAKTESPPQLTKTRRKFRPVFQPLSSEEINKVLETHSSESFARFLTEKCIKTEPPSTPEDIREMAPHSSPDINKKAMGDLMSPEPGCTKKLFCAQSLNKTEVKGITGSQSYTNSLFLQTDLNVPNHFQKSSKQELWEKTAGIYAEDTEENGCGCKHLQRTPKSKPTFDFGIFRSCPGESFRQTVAAFPQAAEKESELKVTRKEFCSVQPVLSPLGSRVVPSNDKKMGNIGCAGDRPASGRRSEIKPQQASAQKDITPKSFLDLDSDVFSLSPLPSPSRSDKKQAQFSGWPVSEAFTLKKQASENKITHAITNSSAAEEPKVSYASRSSSASKRPWADFPHEQISTREFKWSPSLHLSSTDTLRNKQTEESTKQHSFNVNAQNRNKERRGAASMNTLSDFEDPDYDAGKLRGEGTAQQLLSDVERKLARSGTSCYHSASQTYAQDTGLPVSALQGTSSAGGKYSTPLSQNNSGDDSLCRSSGDSLSITPRNQSLEASQSTPSKLISNLNLSDTRCPMSLTKNCDALSRLLLTSPVEKKTPAGGCMQRSSSPHIQRTRQLMELSHDPQKRVPLGEQYAARQEERNTSTKSVNEMAAGYRVSVRQPAQPEVKAKTMTKLSLGHDSEETGSKQVLCGSSKDAPEEIRQIMEKLSSGRRHLFGAKVDLTQNRNSGHTRECQSPLKDHKWKIFKSRNPVLLPKTSDSNMRSASPQRNSGELVISKPMGCKGNQMIRISSPQAQRKITDNHLFSFNSDSCHPSAHTKRSFELLEETDCMASVRLIDSRSPMKRRRLSVIHGTSTPVKSSEPSPKKFDLDESLSTVGGDNSDLNNTLHSTDSEEDEITLIPE